MEDYRIPEYVADLLDRLKENGYSAYVVGGAVRDMCMGHCAHDYDLATSAKPEAMKRVFSDFKVIETGIRHGTLTVLSDGKPVEITTYRADGEYTDGRHPDSVKFSERLEDDLKRRDFTINAMALDGTRLIDLFGGINDIKSKIIRTVGDPEKRFSEDSLRILRAMRFASLTGFDIENKTALAMRKLAYKTETLARERVFSEIMGIVCGEHAARVINEYKSVVSHVLKGFSGSEFIKKAKPREAAVGLALISDGFKSAQEAKNAVKSLKPDKKTYAAAAKLIDILDNPEVISDSGIIKLALSDTAEFAFLAARTVKAADREISGNAVRLLEEKTKRGVCMSQSKLALNGEDIAALGAIGKEIGTVLERLLELAAFEQIPNQKDLLLEKAAEILSEIRK